MSLADQAKCAVLVTIFDHDYGYVHVHEARIMHNLPGLSPKKAGNLEQICG